MRDELLDFLPRVGAALDLETWKVPARGVPRVVCGSVAGADGEVLLDRDGVARAVRELLAPGRVVVGANVAFDLACCAEFVPVRAIFDKYDRGEVYDVLAAEMLHAIAGGHLDRDPRDDGPLRDPATGVQVGRYSLSVVCDHVLGVRDAKARDAWRTSYAILDGTPLELWPREAREYPVDDARNTWRVALVQCGHAPRGDGSVARARNLGALAETARALFALHLGAVRGFAVDPGRIDEIEREVVAARASGEGRFRDAGFVRADGSRDTSAVKRAVAVAYGASGPCAACAGTSRVPGKGKSKNCPACSGTGLSLEHPAIPKTPTGGVSAARDVLVDSGDDVLADFAEWGEDAKVTSTYLPALRDGLTLRPNCPLANERVSYSGVVQTMPRGGRVRECVVARPGTLLASVDFAGVELCTWAQVCLWTVGRSALAEAINSGRDAHAILAADLCGTSYEDLLTRIEAGDKAAKGYRQAAKWGNFGYAGGMGEVKFVLTNRRAVGQETIAPDGARYKGIRFCVLLGRSARCGEEKILAWKDRPTPGPVCRACVEAGREIRNAWFRRWSEARDYFAVVKRVVEQKGAITHFASGVVRGGVTFTEASNGYFSALAAVGAKRALYVVSRECYVDTGSPLWGSRPVGFIHDEIVAEVPENRSSAAAARLGQVMVGEMQAVVPDVKIKAEPALMRRFYKGAEPVWRDGELVPWEPR